MIDIKNIIITFRKYYLAIAFICFSFSMNAGIIVKDAETGLPLPKASIFDKNGVFISVTEEDGSIPETVLFTSYPLNVRYVGYSPVTIESPNIDEVTMVETTFTLPEVVIDEVSRNILYLQAYVREYATIENAKDTLAIFTEQIVDYAIPVGKAKYKGWKKPRVLAQQEFEYIKIEKKKSSLDTLRFSEGGKLRSTNFNIAQKFKVPECILNGDSTEYIKYGKYYPEERWSVVGDRYIYETDGLADNKDHYFQPGILKLFGLTTGMSMDDHKYVFEKGAKPGATVENLIEASENYDLIMKGRLVKKVTEQTEDTKFAYFTEMFVIDRAYISAEEAKELKKDKPVVNLYNFVVPEGIPSPPAEVVKLKNEVIESKKQNET